MRTSLATLLVGLLALTTVAASEPDTTAPWIALHAAHDNATGSLYVKATGRDDHTGGSTITEVAVTVDGVDQDAPASDGAFDESFETVIIEQKLHGPGGFVQVCAQSTDAAGNVSSLECQTVDTRDLYAPWVISTTVAEGTATQVEPFTLVADVEDTQNDIVAVAYSVDGGSWQPMTAEDGSFDGERESAVARVGPLSLGEHEVCVATTDAAGNSSFDDDYYVCRNLTVADGHLPDVTIAVSAATVAIGQPVRVEASATDATGGALQLSLMLSRGAEVFGADQAIGSADDGASVALDTWLAFDEPHVVEVCAVAVDAHDNTTSECIEVEVVGTQRVTGTGSIPSRPQMLGAPADDAVVTVDLAREFDDSVSGTLVRTEPGYDFRATTIESIDVSQGVAIITGVGLVNDVATCTFEATVSDNDSPRPDRTPAPDTFGLELSGCALAPLFNLSTTATLTSGDLVVTG